MSYKPLNEVESVIALGKPIQVVDMFLESYLQGLEYDKWISDKKLQWEYAYPKYIDGVDEDGNAVLIDNQLYIEFDEFIKLTHEVVVGQDVDGVDITEEQLVNVYEPVDVSADMAQWKLYNYAILRKYPPVEDYIDAIVKGDTVAQKAHIDKCLAEKIKWPKA